nr:histidine kinase [Pseudonocardia acidicola]
MARRLRRNQAQREALLRRAIEATDAERRRIAADLHDGVVQNLAGVAFSLGAATRRGGADARQSREAADRVRQAVQSLRSLLVEIYPPNLYEEGLAAALADLAAGPGTHGIEAEVAITAPLDRLGVAETELIYRVAQEGLRNVVAHAAASRVDIRVTAEDGATVLRITDDGRGMDLEHLPSRPGHLGLRALADLAHEVGAALIVESAPGAGTTLMLEVPAR